MFLGDDDFVQTHLHLLETQTGDLSEVPKKQKRKPALLLARYAQLNETRDDAIREAYLSGGYTLKEVGDYFKLHYSRVSKIVAKK